MEEQKIHKETTLEAFKVRSMWLVVGLFGSILISKLISSFEETLQSNLLIAAFIPMIVYMSDAVGTQMESIIIRAISTQRIFNFKKLFSGEFIIVLMLGILFGTLSFILSYFFYMDIRLSMVVSIAVVFSILSSLITGLVIPFIFWKSHQDPAEASGPVATIIQDALSVLIYFLVASILL